MKGSLSLSDNKRKYRAGVVKPDVEDANVEEEKEEDRMGIPGASKLIVIQVSLIYHYNPMTAQKSFF